MATEMCQVTARERRLYCETHREWLVPKAEAEERLQRALDQPGSLGAFCPASGQMFSGATAANDAIEASGTNLSD